RSMSFTVKFTAGVALLTLLAALAFVDYAEACAPTSGNSTSGRKKRSAEEDVHVVVMSNENFELATNAANMEKVDQKLKEFADREGISFRALQNVGKTVENVGGKFGVHFEVGGAFDRCARVLQFIQAAVNSLPEIVSGTVKCGAFDAVHVTKKQ
ncbi:scvp-1, partial [Pristionchus pacificus]